MTSRPCWAGGQAKSQTGLVGLRLEQPGRLNNWVDGLKWEAWGLSRFGEGLRSFELGYGSG